jgi:hypothetical protein
MSVLETACRRDGQSWLLNRRRFLGLRRSAFCFLRSNLQPLQSASRGRESVARGPLSLSLRGSRCVLRTYGHEVLVVTFTFIIAGSEA